MNEDINAKIARLDESSKQAHKRIDALQQTVDTIHELVNTVKVMVTEMQYMKSDVNDIKTKIETYHTKEPNKLLFNAKSTVITGILGILVGAVAALIIK